MPMINRIWPPLAVFILFFVLLAGGSLFYRMVEQMENMGLMMGQMTEQVASMNREMMAIRVAVEKMEGHIGGMGRSVIEGTRQMERVNPMRMMEGVVPGTR